MRVLFALHTPRDPSTGVWTAVSSEAEVLRGRGNEVRIVTPADLSSGWRSSPRWLPLTYPWALWRWLRHETRFDVLIFHSFSGWVTALLQPLSASTSRSALVTQFHGLEPLYHRLAVEHAAATGQRISWLHRLYRGPILDRLLALACRRSARVLCLNEREREFLAAERWAVREKIVVLHPPVPAPFFVSREYERPVTKILFVGQWLPAKGTAALAAAWNELSPRRPDLTLCCAGVRCAARAVLSAFDAEVQSTVTVHETVPREEMAPLYASADLFVLPSHSEGSSIALREAMASGLPVVTTPVGSATDLLRDGESALLIPVGDARALASALESFLESAERRRRCGEGARQVAERLASEPGLVDLLEALGSPPAERPWSAGA